MAFYIATDTEMQSVADAIRAKGGYTEELVFPTSFISAINSIDGDSFAKNAVFYTEATGSAVGPMSSGASANNKTETVTLNPAYVYFVELKRYTKSVPGSNTYKYETTPITTYIRTIVHNGLEWKTQSNMQLTIGECTISGNELTVKATAPYGYVTTLRVYRIAQIRELEETQGE